MSGDGMTALTIRPANEASCADLDRVMRGEAATCQCQRYRLERGESFGQQPVEERRHRLHDQTSCGDPEAPETSGLVAYLDGEPVGWCAVAPRSSYGGLVRNANQTAWRGRHEDRADPTVWAVTCLYVVRAHRGHGISRELARAALEFARSRGARLVEAYPVTERGLTWGEAHPGHLSAYEAAGFTEVHRPSKRRAVVASAQVKDTTGGLVTNPAKSSG